MNKLIMQGNYVPPGSRFPVSVILTALRGFKTMFNFDDQWREMERREQEQGEKNGITRS